MSLTLRSPTLLVDILENQLPESSDTKKQQPISPPFPPASRPGRIPQVNEAVSELASACTKRLSREERALAWPDEHTPQSTLDGGRGHQG